MLFNCEGETLVCCDISLVSPGRPALSLPPPLRERTYLAPAPRSHIHTVPCRCVYACSLLLCQGE